MVTFDEFRRIVRNGESKGDSCSKAHSNYEPQTEGSEQLIGVEVGQTYRMTHSGICFEVLCIDNDECFVKWEDDFYGVFNAKEIMERSTLVK